MRRWLRDPLPEIPQIPETPETNPSREVSGISGVSGSPLYVVKVDPAHALGVLDDLEEREERAAIIEHDGNVPRQWANGLGRLNSNLPPDGFTPSRWLQVLNDSGLLLDRWGSKLEALGWTSADVWGCDASVPDQRLDLAGLALAMCGREVLCVTSETATIKTTGGTVTFYRRPHAEVRRLLWDIQPRGRKEDAAMDETPAP